MSEATASELAEFHEFLGRQLHDPHRSPEEVLDDWRSLRPDRAERERDVAAIRAALRDMEAGEVGMDAEEFFRELDAEIRRRMGQ